MPATAGPVRALECESARPEGLLCTDLEVEPESLPARSLLAGRFFPKHFEQRPFGRPGWIAATLPCRVPACRQSDNSQQRHSLRRARKSREWWPLDSRDRQTPALQLRGVFREWDRRLAVHAHAW